jgi:hypothetical protein
MFWANEGLRIIVSNQIGTGSSFFLYNTFSTPELRPSKKFAHFYPKRFLDTTTESLNVDYPFVNYPFPGVSQAVLNNAIADRTVGPHHPLSGNPWDAPFFYEDSRHVFYVTTEEQLVKVPQWSDFGVVVTTQKPIAEIPRLVLKPGKGMVELAVPSIHQPGFGVVDPTPIDYYISEDAYIESAIGTSGTVRYGDKDIGPSGSEIRTIRVR